METSDVPTTSPPPTDRPAAGLPPRIRALFAALLLGLLLAVLDQTVTGTAAWTIVRDLGGGSALEQLPWLATAYMMSSTVATPLFGRCSDLFGRRRVYLVAVALFLAGSLLGGYARTLAELIAARAVQGLGAGGMIALTFAVVADVVPPRERGRYTGAAMSVVGLASVGGPVLGGFLAGQGGLLGITTSWRWVFYLNLPIGLAVAAVTAYLIPASAPGDRGQVDALGAGLLVGGVWSWLLVADWGGDTYAWSSAPVLGLIAAGIILLALFAVREATAARPLVPTSLLSNPVVVNANLISLGMGAGLLGSVFYATLYLQLVGGMDPETAGLHMVPLMLGLIVSSAVTGRRMVATGRYRVFPVLGSALATLGLALLALAHVGATGWPMALLLLVTGLGVGTATAPLPVVSLNAAAPRDHGVASSFTTFTQTLGGVLGAAVFGAVLNALMRHALAGTEGAHAGSDAGSIAELPPRTRQLVVDAFTHSSHVVFLAAAGVTAATTVLACLLREIPLRTEFAPESA